MDKIKDILTHHNWREIYNGCNQKKMVYEKSDNEVCITYKNGKIYISTPLKNSDYNYETEFNMDNFGNVLSYVDDKLQYLE